MIRTHHALGGCWLALHRGDRSARSREQLPPRASDSPEYVAAACGLGGAVHTVATPARNRIFVAGDEG